MINIPKSWELFLILFWDNVFFLYISNKNNTINTFTFHYYMGFFFMYLNEPIFTIIYKNSIFIYFQTPISIVIKLPFTIKGNLNRLPFYIKKVIELDFFFLLFNFSLLIAAPRFGRANFIIIIFLKFLSTNYFREVYSPIQNDLVWELHKIILMFSVSC